MDIKIKNSLDDMLKICQRINIFTESDITDVFVKDIYNFIFCISLNNAEKRIEYFNKIYFQGQKPIDIFSISEQFSFDSFKCFCDMDNSVLKGKTIQTTKAAKSFYSILGNYYLSSKFDKKDIDIRQFAEYIKQLDELQEKFCQTKELVNQSISENKKELKKSDTDNIISSKQNEAEGEPPEAEESLEELLQELNSLIGLDSVKKEVEQQINLIKVKNKSEEFGEKVAPLSLHLVFYGNPGTGKTTVARLIAKIYKCLGVLSSGQLVETDRGGLVGGYVGQTAIKTQEIIDKAMGGILFIDEAYALTHGKGENDFGQEAVDTILKSMEDHRDNLIVIVAGYPDLMKGFIESNPGLKSRFNNFINFEDYKPNELIEIFKLQCKKEHLILSADCEKYLIKYFTELYNYRQKDYANGRDVRNYFEKAVKMRANRIADKLDNITKDEFLTITIDDLINASKISSEI